ncbi:MAG TPA: hypothetical protein VLS96_16095 [Nodosilinea sp.]|nr:hypothetical protein [Nodosilinea sp.]
MNQIKTLALLALLSGLLAGPGYLIIGGPTGILIGLALAAELAKVSVGERPPGSGENFEF